jgi:hypothetical protein
MNNRMKKYMLLSGKIAGKYNQQIGTGRGRGFVIGLCLFWGFVVFGLSSCLKTDNNSYSVQVAAVTLVNAAPESGPLDFISDGNRNYLPALFDYDTVLAYRSAYPGFRVFGVTAHNSNMLLTSQQFYLEPGVAYSLFVTDTLGDLKLAMIKDSLGTQDSTKAMLRFTNMSQDAPALSLELSPSADNSEAFTDIAYRKTSNFTAITPADSYTLKLVNSQTGKTLASKTGLALAAGKVYTVWAKGVFNSKDSKLKLGIGVMENE